MSTVKVPVAVVCTFVWIGFVCAISFMEAWLKFRAPGITLSLGLGIGRIVFSALNIVEWVMALSIVASFILSKQSLFTIKKITFFIPLLILIAQTVWLLPQLDARAEMHIQGEIVPPSFLHFYYVGMEIVKVISLIWFGITLFEHQPETRKSFNF